MNKIFSEVVFFSETIQGDVLITVSRFRMCYCDCQISTSIYIYIYHSFVTPVYLAVSLTRVWSV